MKDELSLHRVIKYAADKRMEEEMKKLNIKVLLDEGAKMPTKAHEADAGFDLYAPKDFTVYPGYATVIDSGVHMQIPRGYVGFIKSKSGLNVKNGIHCEGVIDSGYTGSIILKVYNDGTWPMEFKAGHKVTQIVILPIPDAELQITDSLDDSERGAHGFGSSGL